MCPLTGSRTSIPVKGPPVFVAPNENPAVSPSVNVHGSAGVSIEIYCACQAVTPAGARISTPPSPDGPTSVKVGAVAWLPCRVKLSGVQSAATGGGVRVKNGPNGQPAPPPELLGALGYVSLA
jgi:hypothetical protein